MTRSKNAATKTVVQALGEGSSAERLIEGFDVLVEAAGGIKKLKELILDLAVRGSLTSREPGDGTVDSLVADIGRKRKLLASRGIRVRADLDNVPPEDTPYDVPPGWRWVRLGFLGGFLGGGTPAKSNVSFWNGPIPWVSPKDMKRPYIDDAEDHISAAAVEGSAVKLIPAPSLLFVIRGMILAHSFPVALTTRDVTINQDMKALVLASPDVREFVLRACQAARSRVLARVERSTHGTCRLDSEVVETLPIALPPLDEQRRIIAKVDRLLALCDDLEARQSKKRQLEVRVTKSALDALANGASASQPIDLLLDRVFGAPAALGRAENLVPFRNAIVDLAARGALHSAGVLDGSVQKKLESRVAERRRLWWEGQRMKGTISKASRDWKDPYTAPLYELPDYLPALPAGWAYAPIAVLGADPLEAVQTGPFGALLLAEEFVSSGVPVIAVGNVTAHGLSTENIYYVTPEKAAQLSRYDVQAGDLLFARSGATLGKACVAPSYVKDWRMTGHILRVRLDRSIILPEVAAHWIRSSSSVKRQIQETIRGGTRPGYNTSLLESIALPVPPVDEQHHILVKLHQLLKLCDDSETQLKIVEDRAAKFAEAVVRELVA